MNRNVKLENLRWRRLCPALPLGTKTTIVSFHKNVFSQPTSHLWFVTKNYADLLSPYDNWNSQSVNNNGGVSFTLEDLTRTTTFEER